MGSWLVKADGRAVPATVGQEADLTGDAPTKELDRADTDRDKLVRADPGATELTHGKGVLRFGLADGRRWRLRGR